MPNRKRGIEIPYRPSWPYREFWDQIEETPRFGFRGAILISMMIGALGLGILLGSL